MRNDIAWIVVATAELEIAIRSKLLFWTIKSQEN